MVDITNACLEGVDATTSLHLCFGNFRGRPATSYRSYAAFAPHFGGLQLDALSLEFANRSMWETELWAEHGGDKILVAGVIDVKARDLETPEIVAVAGPDAAAAPWRRTSCGCPPTAATPRPPATSRSRRCARSSRARASCAGTRRRCSRAGPGSPGSSPASPPAGSAES